jgi:hypothetical protein
VMMPSANRTDVQSRSRAPSKTLALTIVVAREGFTPSDGLSVMSAPVPSRVRAVFPIATNEFWKSAGSVVV